VWAPLGDNVRIVSANVGCTPCTMEKRLACSTQHCLEGITAAMVARHAFRLLQPSRNRTTLVGTAATATIRTVVHG
jgi:hypothetical protein